VPGSFYPGVVRHRRSLQGEATDHSR
jgi:hypothetical protein